MSSRAAGADALTRAVERHLGVGVRAGRPLGGGCIHEARLVELTNGRLVFVKGSAGVPREQFEAEAAGLEAIAHTGTIRVPEVLAIGGDPACLILEAIASGPPAPDFAERLGQRLAALHRAPAPNRFGFERSNFLGSTPQPNRWEDDWVEFFGRHRLGHQLELARSRGLTDRVFDALAERLLARLHEVLAGPPEPPCLVHGDLWSGNVLSDENGDPVLVDPAVSYSRREAELGMMVLFGNFPQALYRAYDEAFPLAAGWRERVEIYKLYHLVNHLNLFGAGYRASCLEILRRFA